MNFPHARKINDLIGVRAVCAYVDDIYKVADLIQKTAGHPHHQNQKIISDSPRSPAIRVSI